MKMLLRDEFRLVPRAQLARAKAHDRADFQVEVRQAEKFDREAERRTIKTAVIVIGTITAIGLAAYVWHKVG